MSSRGPEVGWQGDGLAEGDERGGRVVVAVQQRRVDAGGVQDPAQPVPLAVDGRVDHPVVVGEVGEVHDGPGGGRVVAGHGDELRFAGDQDPPREALGDP